MSELDKIRIDKWLWAVRIYKTRTIATAACTSGKVKVSNKSVKPSYLIKINEIITIQKGLIKHTYRAVGIIGKRVSAKIANENIEDLTSEDELFKHKAATTQSIGHRDKGMGRPTKKDRRQIEKIKWRN